MIEQIRNIDDKHNVEKRLLTREAFWCAQLCTLQTNGLNKRTNISPFKLHLFFFHHFLIVSF